MHFFTLYLPCPFLTWLLILSLSLSLSLFPTPPLPDLQWRLIPLSMGNPKIGCLQLNAIVLFRIIELAIVTSLSCSSNLHVRIHAYTGERTRARTHAEA
jgi:hypothetical protein